MIYHVCKKSDWEKTIITGEYQADSLSSQGFIHCSTASQVSRVLKVFYQGQQDLVLLVIDPELLVSPLKWEPGMDKPDELFPHVYGTINTAAVLKTVEIPIDKEGNFEVPFLER